MLPDDQTPGTGLPADAPVAPVTDQPVAQTPPVEEMPAAPAISPAPGVEEPTSQTPPAIPGEETPPVPPVAEEGGTEGPGDTTPPTSTV